MESNNWIRNLYERIRVCLIRCLNYFIERLMQYAPIALIALALVLILLSKNVEWVNFFLTSSKNFLSTTVFCESRIEMLSTISVVLIGFYITAISVFGANYSYVVIKISQNNYSKKFMSYSVQAILSAFVFFLVTIFIDTIQWDDFVFVYASIFLWLLTAFVRFTFVVLKMYSTNIRNAAGFARDEEQNCKELIVLMREIRDMVKSEALAEDNLYFEKQKIISERQRTEAKKIPKKEKF